MTLHQALKEATDSIHTKLEKDLNLLREDLSLEDYINLLKKFYGFYHSLESTFPVPAERKKTHLLSDDLAYFGVKDLSQVPRFNSFPDHTDTSFLMGVSYVIEGSTLGGSILSKHFKEKFNLSGDGVKFFECYKENTFIQWKDFLNRLETFSHSKECDQSQVVKGGVFTFCALHDWLIT